MRLGYLLVALVAADESPALRHRYYVLRHGQSLANVEGVISSDPRVARLDHGLSEVGQEQAATAATAVVQEAERTGAEGIAIVSSDFRRAWQTANSVRAAVLAAGVHVWPSSDGPFEARALRERSFGELSGEADERYHDVWVEDARDAFHEAFGVESVLSVRERARSVVDALESELALQDGRRWMVVLVAHGDVLQILQTAFTPSVDPRAHRSLDHLPTATLRGPLEASKWPTVDTGVIDSRWHAAAQWPPKAMPLQVDAFQ